MDGQKRSTVLNYISAILGQKIDSLLELKNGIFYNQLIDLLDQWKKRTKPPDTDLDRLTSVRSFLQDYYGEDVSINQYLKFDLLLQPECSLSENILELELAKIAVVLIGIGILDKNREHFIGAAMQLPPEMHLNTMSIIQSVVQAGSSSEVALTDSIEQVLLEPSEDRSSPPICNLQRTQFNETCHTSTPKDARRYSSAVASSILHKDSPLRCNNSYLNCSLREITSPFRGLSIDVSSPSSPLAQFVQSPQFIQKAVLAQKELEIRKLKQMLSDQNFYKDELQFNLQDKMSECAAKDAEILRLQDKIRELQHLKEEITELQDVKMTCSDLQDEIYRVNQKMLRFEQYKEKCQILEKEASDHYLEVEQLYKQIKTLEAEVRKYKDSADTIRQLDQQVSYQRQQLEDMGRCQQEWQNERKALMGNQDMLKDTISKLQDELDCLLARQNDNKGESMDGIFLDMQVGELRCQIEELKQQEDCLQQQIEELKQQKDCLQQQLNLAQEYTHQKEEELQSLTAELSEKNGSLQSLMAKLSEKDDCLEKVNSLCHGYSSEVIALKSLVERQEQSHQELEVTIKELTAKVEDEGTINANKLMSVENKVHFLEGNLKEKMNECADLGCQVMELTARITQLCDEIQKRNEECSVHCESILNLTDEVTCLKEKLKVGSEEALFLSQAKNNVEVILNKKEDELGCLNSELNSKEEIIARLEADKQKMKDTLRQLQVQNEDLLQLVDVQKEEISKLSKELNEKSQDVTHLSAEITEKTKEESLLKEEKNSLLQQLTELKQVMDTKDEEMKVTLSEKAQLEIDLQCLRESGQKAREELLALNEIHNHLQIQMNLVTHQMELKVSECTEYVNTISGLTENLALLECQLLDKSGECSENKKTVSQLEEKLKEAGSENDKTQAEMCELKREIDILTDKKDEAVREKQGIQESLEEKVCIFSKEIQKKNEECAVHSKSILNLTNEVLCLKAKLKSESEEALSISEEKNNLEVILRKKEEDLGCLNIELSKYEEIITELELDKEKMKDTLRQLQVQNEDLLQLVDVQKNETNNLRKEVAVKSQDVSQLLEKVSQLQEKLHTMNVTLEVKDSLCLEQTTRLSELSNKFDQLEQELQSRTRELEEICATNAALKEDLIAKDGSVNSLQQEVSHAREIIQRFEGERKDSQDQLRCKEEENNELHQLICNLKIERTENQEALIQLRDTVEKNAKSYREVQDNHSIEVLQLKRQFDDLKGKLLDLESDLKEMTQAVSERNEKVATLEDIRSRLEKQVGSMNQDMQTKEADCQTHASKLSELQDQVLYLEKKLETDKHQLNSLSEANLKMEQVLHKKDEELVFLQEDVSHKADLIVQLEAGSAASEASLRQALVEVDELKKLVSSKEEELDELKVSLSEKEQVGLEVQDLSESLREMTEELNALRINNGQLEVELDSVTRQLQEKLQECSELTKNICNQSEQIACLIRKSGEKEAECEELTKTASKLTEKVTCLSSQLEVMVCECSVHTERILELTKQVDHCICQYDAKVEECTESSRVQLELVEEMRILKNQYEAKVLECSEQNNRLSSLSEGMNSLKSEYAAKSEECAETEARLTRMIDQFHLVSDQMQVQVDKCSEHKKELQEITEEVKELEGELEYKLHEINTMSKENIQMMENLKAKENICSGLLKEKNELVTDLRARDDRLISLQNELTDKNEIMVALQEMRDSVLEQIKVKEKEVEKLAAEVEELKEDICQSQIKLEEREQMCQEKTKSCAELEEDISKYVSELHVTQSKREDLEVKVQAMMDEMKALTDQKNEQMQELNDLQKDMEENIRVLNNQIQAKTEECAGYVESISELTGKVLDYEGKLKVGNEKIVTLSEANDKLQDVIGEKEMELMSLRTKLTCLATDRESMQEKIEQMQADNENLSERNACQQKELTTLEEQLDKKSNAVIELSEMLKLKSNEFSELLSEKNNLFKMNFDLEITCGELRAEVAKYKSLCSDFESKLKMMTDELNCERTRQLSKLEELSEAKEMVQRGVDVCNGLKKEVSEKSAFVIKLQAEKDQMQGEIKMLKLSWKEAAELVQEKDNKLQVLEAEQYGRTKLVSTLKEQMAAQAATIQELTQAVNGKDSDIQLKTRLLQEQTGSLEASKMQVSELTRKLDESTGAVEALQAELKKKEQQILHLVEAESKYQTLERSRETEKQEQKMLISKLEVQIQWLQEENTAIMERETRQLNNFDAQIRTANEFCSSLQKQLDGANSNLELSQKEVKHLQALNQQKEQHTQKAAEKNTVLVSTLKQEHDNYLKLQKRFESYTGKYEEIRTKYESIQKENKSLSLEVNQLKTALNFSERKLREYQHQLDQAGTALLGDPSHFKKVIEEHCYDSLDESIDSRGSGRFLRSRSMISSGSTGLQASLNETIISGDKVMLKREVLASSSSDLRNTGTGKQQTEDRLSICSTSSSQSKKSVNSVQAACFPTSLSCANEPEGPEFEWDRLSELQRRNTMYLPHMKSAYPVEMQIVSSEKFTDDSLRLSSINTTRRTKASPKSFFKPKSVETKSKGSVKETETKLQKRKGSNQSVGDGDISEASPPKQIRTAPVYQRPGPPTPGKQPRRISGKFTPSHGISPAPGSKLKLLGSPIARPNRRSPRLQTVVSPVAVTPENRRESVMFNIGFTPKKDGGPKGGLMRQKGFISKEKYNGSKATITDSNIRPGKGKVVQQTEQTFRKPLGTRNYLETGI